MPIYALVGSRAAPWWKAGLAGAACTAVTHPLLWFVWSRIFSNYTTFVISGELLVAVIETLIFFALLRPIPLRLAVSAAFLANAASYALGTLL